MSETNEALLEKLRKKNKFEIKYEVSTLGKATASGSGGVTATQAQELILYLNQKMAIPEEGELGYEFDKIVITLTQRPPPGEK